MRILILYFVFFPFLSWAQISFPKDTVFHEAKISLASVTRNEGSWRGFNSNRRRLDFFEIAYERIIRRKMGINSSVGWVDGKYKLNTDLRFYSKVKSYGNFVGLNLIAFGEGKNNGDYENANVLDAFVLASLGHKWLTKSKKYSLEIYFSFGRKIAKWGEERSYSDIGHRWGAEYNFRLGKRFGTLKKLSKK